MNHIYQKKTFIIKLVKTILIHILLWVIYVLSEYIANLPHLAGDEHLRFLVATLLSLPVLVIPTYLVAWYGVPNYLKKDKVLFFVIFLLIAALAVLYGRIKWLELVNYIHYDYVGSMPASKVLKNVIRDYAVIALAVCIYIIDDWKKKEKENERLIVAKAKSDLELLKRQLHPHFLFNTLNNIYSLALKNLDPSDQTVESILKLSRLLEYLVYQSGEETVPFKQEIALVKNYIDLERLRHGDELYLEIDFGEINDNILTAPLIMLPFVENCFKHGGKNRNGTFWIRIDIKVFSNHLTVHISNSKRVLRKQPQKEKGVGLKNIRERMEILYPGTYQLNIEDTEELFTVDLQLKLKQ